MATTKFKLDTELYARIVELQSDLNGAAQELRDAWDARSERWRESDDGTAADSWIETLGNLADELDNITEEPEE